jgi:hypothetical protein
MWAVGSCGVGVDVGRVLGVPGHGGRAVRGGPAGRGPVAAGDRPDAGPAVGAGPPGRPDGVLVGDLRLPNDSEVFRKNFGGSHTARRHATPGRFA